jgi:2-polyprenyl-6-methoxyphenol hydroxylase-like FAD-dependent oxidoreductase
MLAAILLGRAGHRVAALERYTTLYNLPRVGIIHDDVQRMRRSGRNAAAWAKSLTTLGRRCRQSFTSSSPHEVNLS